MSVWKGDFYGRMKWHIINLLCLALLLFAVYRVLKAEWPF